MKRWLAALPICIAVQLADAAEIPPGPDDDEISGVEGAAWPTVREITFEGNEVTQEITMRREIVIAEGDPADPRRIERSRQAIQDLGLFREVSAREEPVPGGTRLVFKVREKWYLLPYPRVEANSDGDTGLGLQMKWHNLWGLNHRLDAVAVRRQYDREDRDNSYNYYIDYGIPFLGSSRNALAVSLSHANQSSSDDGEHDYDELTEHFRVVFSRALNRHGPPSQGWKAGGGIGWQHQSASGEHAPESWGMATSLVGLVSFNDMHDHIYSRTGVQFTSGIGVARDGLASDYDNITHYSTYRRYVHVGERAHQAVHYLVEVGGYHGGPLSRQKDYFELGGSTKLRGYDREIIEGDFLYYGAVQYLRPVYWDWLRLLAMIEAGSAIADVAEPVNKTFYASIGLGLRVRFTWFVDLEFDIGCAYPLIAEDKLRFFASAI